MNRKLRALNKWNKVISSIEKAYSDTYLPCSYCSMYTCDECPLTAFCSDREGDYYKIRPLLFQASNIAMHIKKTIEADIEGS